VTDIGPARLSARLVMSDGRTVRVPVVPLRSVECHLRSNQDRIRSVELKPRRP
jgi:hypothetical protein